MHNLQLDRPFLNAVSFIGQALQHPWLPHVQLELDSSINERVSVNKEPLSGNLLRVRLQVVFAKGCQQRPYLFERFSFDPVIFRYHSVPTEGHFVAEITRKETDDSQLYWRIGMSGEESELWYTVTNGFIQFEREQVCPAHANNLLLLANQAPELIGTLAVRQLLPDGSHFYHASVEHLGVAEQLKKQAVEMQPTA